MQRIVVALVLGSCVRTGLPSDEGAVDARALVDSEGLELGSHSDGWPRVDAFRRDAPWADTSRLDAFRLDKLPIPNPDATPGAAPPGCDPKLSWQTCGYSCSCTSGTCHIWCPPTLPSCLVSCQNNAICIVVCDTKCTIIGTMSQSCNYCARSGNGSGHNCTQTCPTPGCK